MTHYLLNFVVYTCAMVGMIFFALYVYKKFSVTQTKTSQTNFLEVEDSLTIGIRKQLYVVRAGDEKFLIASDAERTTMLAKLNNSKQLHGKNEIVSETLKSAIEFPKIEEKQEFNEEFTHNMDNLYANYTLHGTNTSEVLRNIVSSGERFNG